MVNRLNLPNVARLMSNPSFSPLQAIRVMEVPVVKIKAGDPGSESGEKLIKSIVNMVRLEDEGFFACLRSSQGVWLHE